MPFKGKGMGRHGSEVLHFKGGGAVDGHFVAQVQAVGAVNCSAYTHINAQVLDRQGQGKVLHLQF